jgi:hypothetical protein
MKNAMSSSISIILIFIFMAGCVATIPPPTPISTTGSLASEAETAKPIPSPTIPSSQLGDSQIRQIDGMQMVYVPAGEFRMGSESEEVDFALQQCRNYGTNCQRSYFQWRCLPTRSPWMVFGSTKRKLPAASIRYVRLRGFANRHNANQLTGITRLCVLPGNRP